MYFPRPSSRLSFDDLIELRFLPSRRRRRDADLVTMRATRRTQFSCPDPPLLTVSPLYPTKPLLTLTWTQLER